jgi:hypothetical protein
MKRITLITSLAASLLAIALQPAIATAERHHRHRHHHAAQTRFEHFGPSNLTAPASADAGPIVSFTGGVLTIKLGDGSTVAGKVTTTTELKCASASPVLTARAADHGSASDDNSQDVGDDNGRDAEEHAGEGIEDNSTASCQMSDLLVGTTVRSAELRLSSAGASFSEVEIVR